MSQKTRFPAINLAGIKDQSVRAALTAIAERIETGDGTRPNANKLDKVIRLRDLVDAGIASVLGAFSARGPGFEYANPGLVDFSVPPAPTGLAASGAMASIFLSWDQAPFRNYSHTEIWRAGVDDIGQAVLNGTAIAPVYGDYVGGGAAYFYWIRFVSNAGVKGPFNATAGVAGATAQNPSYLMDILAEEYGTESEAPFFQLDEPATIGGVLIPAGTYMKTAFIYEAAITSAQIGSLVADKIAAGTITAAVGLTAATITGGSLNINNKFKVDANGNTEIVSATTGARLEIKNNVIKVFDASGVKRVQIGDLTA